MGNKDKYKRKRAGPVKVKIHPEDVNPHVTSKRLRQRSMFDHMEEPSCKVQSLDGSGKTDGHFRRSYQLASKTKRLRSGDRSSKVSCFPESPQNSLCSDHGKSSDKNTNGKTGENTKETIVDHQNVKKSSKRSRSKQRFAKMADPNQIRSPSPKSRSHEEKDPCSGDKDQMKTRSNSRSLSRSQKRSRSQSKQQMSENCSEDHKGRRKSSRSRSKSSGSVSRSRSKSGGSHSRSKSKSASRSRSKSVNSSSRSRSKVASARKNNSVKPSRDHSRDNNCKRRNSVNDTEEITIDLTVDSDEDEEPSTTDKTSEMLPSRNQESETVNPVYRLLCERPFLLTPFGLRMNARGLCSSQDGADKQKLSGLVQIKVVSYNVLSQDLVEANMFLYQHCEQDCLDWNFRQANFLREFDRLQADVLCLQEVHQNHFTEFFKPQLEKRGYVGAYKKRAGDKNDGCATFVRVGVGSLFELEAIHPVDYLRGDAGLLDRDNVAQVMIIRYKHNPRLRLCISNTHLLFNPKRGDIKLAQLMVLLAEIDRHACVGISPQGELEYMPVIMCGDFNSTPFCDLYNFMLEGRLCYKDLLIREISGQGEWGVDRYLSRSFFPRQLRITDQCQYTEEVETRLKEWRSQLVGNPSYGESLEGKSLKESPGHSLEMNSHGKCDLKSVIQDVKSRLLPHSSEQPGTGPSWDNNKQPSGCPSASGTLKLALNMTQQNDVPITNLTHNTSASDTLKLALNMTQPTDIPTTNLSRNTDPTLLDPAIVSFSRQNNEGDEGKPVIQHQHSTSQSAGISLKDDDKNQTSALPIQTPSGYQSECAGVSPSLDTGDLDLVNASQPSSQSAEYEDCPTLPVSYQSGTISHNLRLRSVYMHGTYEKPEVTTCHSRANCTVDYIFYGPARTKCYDGETQSHSGRRMDKTRMDFGRASGYKKKHGVDRGGILRFGELGLVSVLRLLDSDEMYDCGGLPNSYISSDHLAIAAVFFVGCDEDR